MKKKLPKYLLGVVFIGLGAIICLPVLLLVSGSLADSLEWRQRAGGYLQDTREYIAWRWIPAYPTLEHYKRLLFFSPAFFRLFWNSLGMTGSILLGQLAVAVPAAWAFAVYRFRGRNVLFSLYVILMLLPFQVTMLSSYLVLNRLSLLDTHYAIILPAIFSTFPVFLCYGGFCSIPRQMLEAARIDGAGEIAIFLRLGLPLGKSGLLSAMVLGFLEYWNLMEQPMAFLDDRWLWPLSLYLPEITWGQAGYAFCASVITLIPAAFVFIMGQDYLEQGIIYSGLKG